jgi:hypothetical protein
LQRSLAGGAVLYASGLAEVIDSAQVGPEALRATRVRVLHLFARIERLGGQIDEAFDVKAFLPNLGEPTSRANRRRFNAYIGCHKKKTGLLFEAIALWAMSSGTSRRMTGFPW